MPLTAPMSQRNNAANNNINPGHQGRGHSWASSLLRSQTNQTSTGGISRIWLYVEASHHCRAMLTQSLAKKSDRPAQASSKRKRGIRHSKGIARSISVWAGARDRKSTRLNSSHVKISYAVFCLKKKKR